MSRVPPLLFAVVLTGCMSVKRVERADWPALAQDHAITVGTLDGTTRKLQTFTFTTDGLSGRLAGGSPTDSVLIPLDSIAVVRVVEVNRQATLLVLAAAATAAFIMKGDEESDIRPAPIPRPPAAVSCPFIYSFDGEKYVFDSETYAGAIARGLERSDVDNLDHLRPVDGVYRLRLTNERPETHYTDELSLLVVDHARGLRAVPDVAGVVHIVGPTAPAAHVTAFSGDSIPARAGWEMTLPRPAGDTIALVLRTRNTPLAPFAIHHVLSLLGSDVYQWYAALRADLMTRAVVRSWIDREGSLDVQIDRGSEWTSAARIPDVGPAIAKTNVILLDVRGVSGDSIRVRLESSPNLWLLERAEVARYGGLAKTFTLRASRATDERGADVRAALSDRDSRYLVTVRGSDVTIQFDAPPVRAGFQRTVLARTTGHYYAHTNDSVAPNRPVVARLMSDRRFLQEYFAAEWERAGGAPLR